MEEKEERRSDEAESASVKKKRKKERKPEAVDDGRTIAEMNVEGFPWYDKHKDDRREYSKKERRQILRAAYLRMLPVLGVMLLGLTLTALLMWLLL